MLEIPDVLRGNKSTKMSLQRELQSSTKLQQALGIQTAAASATISLLSNAAICTFIVKRTDSTTFQHCSLACYTSNRSRRRSLIAPVDVDVDRHRQWYFYAFVHESHLSILSSSTVWTDWRDVKALCVMQTGDICDHWCRLTIVDRCERATNNDCLTTCATTIDCESFHFDVKWQYSWWRE